MQFHQFQIRIGKSSVDSGSDQGALLALTEVLIQLEMGTETLPAKDENPMTLPTPDRNPEAPRFLFQSPEVLPVLEKYTEHEALPVVAQNTEIP